MSNEKTINVAKAVQVQIHAAEEAIETAMGEAANLIETFVTSRRALQLSASRSTDVQANTLKAMQALNEAQAYMTEAHKGLTRIRQHVGIPASAMIPLWDSPEDEAGKRRRPTGRLAEPLATT